jgi:hypothetical protein
MKKVAVGVIICLFSLFIVTTAFASLAQFAGDWENVNPDTRGVTALKITVSGINVKVHAWGQCHPTDCDWGNMQAHAYGPNVSSNLAGTAQAVSVVHKESFAERLMILRSSGTQLQAATYTRFTDTSGRTNYADVETFKRKVAPSVAEDCVGFNPATATVTKINNRWKIVDGSHWMFDFGTNKAAADKSLAVIKFYKMNRSCFVGRPDPSFTYLLVGNNAPVGDMSGQDCIKFNPAAIEVKEVGGRWKIVQGNMWMYDFESKKAEAYQAFNIIKKYGFTNQCFVARPNPPFHYLHK